MTTPRPAVCSLLLAACVFWALVVDVTGQNAAATAVPPAYAVQPLYVCKMEVKDLPQFDGLPSPEMEAGNSGLYAATLGMMDQWKMFNNGDTPDTTTGVDSESSVSDPNYGNGGGGDGSVTPVTGFILGTKPSRRSSSSMAQPGAVQAPVRTQQPAAAAGAGGTYAQASAPAAAGSYVQAPAAAGAYAQAPAPAPSVAGAYAPAPAGAYAQAPVAQQPQLYAPQAAPLAPPPATAHSYIVSRPATGSLDQYGGSYAPAAATLASAPSYSQHFKPRQTLNYDVSIASLRAAAAAGDRLLSQQQQHWLYSTNNNSAAAAGAGGGVTPVGAAPFRHFNRTAAAAAAMAAAAPVLLDDFDDGYDRPPLTSPTRRLFAASRNNSRHVCNKGTPTNSTTGPLGKSSFSGKVSNIVGITMADSGVVPADAAIAVGPSQVVHVVNSMVKILPVTKDGDFPKSVKPGQMRLIPLPDWFALVASPCDGGYINPSATYDKEVGRFLISAICGGDTNQVVLSVSATSDALGTWILYSFAGETTQGTRMQCINESYPISFHSQVGYNKDGIYLTFIHNCPSNQETATGAMLYALPKWAVYKGATYFWCPVWTAWEIYDAVGQKNNDEYYPGAFIQLQPVIPQRAADVQADVTYFVSDNINWVTPLQRSTFTLASLINTGSLWLYEGPNSASPAPLLVARLINRGMRCDIQTPDVKLTQPNADPAAGLTYCQKLDGGAMRPPGVWDGGAVLYANKIYIVDRGPDLASPFMGLFMPTLYWAIITPSFCVGGPCGPWFGTDWGWSEGWDWVTGTWQANSDRGRYGYKDPSYYNQVFLFPSTQQPPPTSYIQGRRRLQKAYVGAGYEASSSSSSQVGYSGVIPGTGRPVTSRVQMLALVSAARVYGVQMGQVIRAAAVAQAQAGMSRPWHDLGVTPAVFPAAAAAATAAVAATPVTDVASAVLDPAFMQAAGLSQTSNSSSGVRGIRAAVLNVTQAAGPAASLAVPAAAAAAGAAAGVSDRSVHAAFFLNGGWGTNNFAWQGWGMNYYYYDYYQWWREHYFMRNLYMNLRIPPKVNPCKYYKDWIVDNDITFGAINSKHGVIEFVSQGDNPVGLAAPAVAVRGGSMLITYSFSGPFNIPLTNGGIRAYPGVAYSVIDANAPSNTGGAFNLAQAGAGCVVQGGNTRWGSYSGADIHFPSYKVWTAVEYAYQVADGSTSVSNAATNINVFS